MNYMGPMTFLNTISFSELAYEIVPAMRSSINMQQLQSLSHTRLVNLFSHFGVHFECRFTRFLPLELCHQGRIRANDKGFLPPF